MLGVLLMLACFGLLAWVVRRENRRAGEQRQLRERQLRRIGPVLARIGDEAVLFSDPLRLSLLRTDMPGRVTHPVTPDMVVTLEVEGNLTAVRGRNLGAKGAAAVLTPFAIGALFIGNAKIKDVDSRELYLTVQSPQWVAVSRLSQGQSLAARQFVATFDQLARALPTVAP